ncbi:hypothetical protein FNL55_20895 [Tardiphaga sp. vice352]|uniref:hypothetical protein n=1 Tax=Tardiphaga sp. vice352 TaxID=2592816 RepID=UPI00116283F8|nr:hypothetical protein [Tardiphaga sp. vice352]QDM33520.1 hypothetical protein FNL55_20895 [Tardiphaga sp. vice352]
MTKLVNAAAFSYEACSSIEETHRTIMANQMATPIANEKRARDAHFEVQQNAAHAIDTAISLAVASRDAVAASYEGPPKAKNIDEATVFSDTRAVLARMSPRERRKAVDAAIDSGEDSVIAAVLNAPSLTSGFSKLEIDAIRVKWQRERFPKEVDRVARLDRAIDDLLRGGQSMVGFCASFTNAKAVSEAIESERDALARTTN